jgi:hypothetical protein
LTQDFIFQNSYLDNPYKSALTMYDLQMKKPRNPFRNVQSKSPYDAALIKPRNVQSSRSNKIDRNSQHSRAQSIRNESRQQSKKRLGSRCASKTSLSDISTMVQQIQSQESIEDIQKLKPEKPLEDDLKVVENQSDETFAIMELLHNIAKDKIQEILGPLIANLLPNNVKV